MMFPLLKHIFLCLDAIFSTTGTCDLLARSYSEHLQAEFIIVYKLTNR